MDLLVGDGEAGAGNSGPVSLARVLPVDDRSADAATARDWAEALVTAAGAQVTVSRVYEASSLRPGCVDQVVVENLRAGVLDVSGRGHQRDTTRGGDVEQAGDGV